ncbi:MAG: proton-conducting transporter membrane subunit [Bacteriovoracia bacterium]
MNLLLLLIIIIPFFSALIIGVLPRLSENVVSIVNGSVLTTEILMTVSLLIMWAFSGFVPLEAQWGNIYQHADYSFPLVFYLDGYGAIYLSLVTLLSNVTAKYSRYYLHREEGYRRYFVLIMLLVAGCNLLAIAGTLDLLFAGWELVGFSSFLLVAFYWRRQRSAQNALSIFIIYRICDVGLLASTMLTHVVWAEGDRFFYLSQYSSQTLFGAGIIIPIIGGLIVFSCLGKSAQFPFLNWLPRAFEGPTPSSAIFYGSLSIHAGVFLLIRSEPLWAPYLGLKLAIFVIGLCSAAIASIIGRTLSNIKGQIAYAAIAQVGVMFMEISLGLKQVAIVHMLLHAFLRAYQILISPSVVSHLLKIVDSTPAPKKFIPNTRIAKELYRVSLADFYLWPSILTLKFLRNLKERWVISFFGFIGLSLLIFSNAGLLAIQPTKLPSIFLGIITLSVSVIANWKGQSLPRIWALVGFSMLLGVATLFTLDHSRENFTHMIFYVLCFSAWICGWFSVKSFGSLSIDEYHGLFVKKKKASLVFLGVFIVLVSIPLSPTFAAEDLLLHWTYEKSKFVTILIATSCTFVSIATGRILARVCFGKST